MEHAPKDYYKNIKKEREQKIKEEKKRRYEEDILPYIPRKK